MGREDVLGALVRRTGEDAFLGTLPRHRATRAAHAKEVGLLRP
ncbi:hypothetical protein [Streptomyces longisporus]